MDAPQWIADLGTRRVVYVVSKCRADLVVVASLNDHEKLFVDSGHVLSVLERLVIDDEEQPEFELPIPP
jgi:hypothetical protein